MNREVSERDLVDNVSDYLDRMVQFGERFTIVRSGVPVAELRPVKKDLTLSELKAVLDSLPKLTDEEWEAFAADIERARREKGLLPDRSTSDAS